MKNKVFRFFSILTLLLSLLALAGCEGMGGLTPTKVKLETPANVKVDETTGIKITWDEVPNATSYIVYFYRDGSCVKSVEGFSGLVVDFLTPGSYEVGVRAFGELTSTTVSDMSALVPLLFEGGQQGNPEDIELPAPKNVNVQYNSSTGKLVVNFDDNELYVNASGYQCLVKLDESDVKFDILTSRGDTLDVSDLSTGTYQVYVKALTEAEGYKNSEISTSFGEFTVEKSNNGSNDVVLTGYYAAASGLTKDALEDALNIIVTTTHKKKTTYDSIRYLYTEIDADPDKPGNIILFYTHYSVKGSWDGGNTYNREHVWPQSYGCNKSTTQGSDAHHVRPTNVSANSARGNRKFKNLSGTEKDYGISSGDYFEPKDFAKGDCARIVFYMLVRYPELYSNLSQVADLPTLLEWNELDPVDVYEVNRNEAVFGIQGNRNPFIDHPELANLIWR